MSRMVDALRRNRHEAYGAAALVVITLIAAVVVAAYQHKLTPSLSATVKSDRAGLLLLPEADVSVFDVRVGRVSGVRPDGTRGVLIDVELDPDQARLIPANVSARVVSPTVFGPKYVDLVPPANPSLQPIAEGGLIERSHVQVEANAVFDNLIGVLNTVQPVKINTALGALSTALNGRGEKLGRTLSDLNTFLKRVNPNLPALRSDLQGVSPVLNTYADASPDLIDLFRNVTRTSNTVVDQESELDTFTSRLTAFADESERVLDKNADDLTETLDVLRPTTALLHRYAPVLPCTFASLNLFRKVTEPPFGGDQPGLRTLTTFQPGDRPYRYPDNLPKLGVDAPGCYGGIPEVGTMPRHVYFPDGSPRLNSRDQMLTPGDTPLALILFGNDMGPTLLQRFQQGPKAVQDTAERGPGAAREMAGDIAGKAGGPR